MTVTARWQEEMTAAFLSNEIAAVEADPVNVKLFRDNVAVA